jgi:ABC-2 type transport system permease protein
MGFVSESALIYGREMRPLLREPWSLVFNLTQPLIFLGLFGPLIGGMVGTGDGPVWQWFVPGILMMLVISSTGGVGYNLLLEMTSGSHERLLVTPMSRSAILVGRSLKEMIQLLVQALLIIVVVLPFGFQVYPAGILVGLVLLSLVGIGLGGLSTALAIAVRQQEWMFWMVQQTFLFPLLILSGTLLPLDGGPEWMQVAARLNPLTHIVNAERALFMGDFSSPSLLPGIIGAVVIAVIGMALGTRAMQKG